MRSRGVIGALIGMLSAAVAVGVGEFVAAFVRPAAAPVIAVGNRLIVLTPESAKQSGIRAAGTNDKLYLLIGIYLLLAVFGAIVGQAALRRLEYGLVGIGVFGIFGVYCALTAPAAQLSDVLPTIVGTLAAAAVLVMLVRAAGGSAPAGAVDPPEPDRRALLQAGAASAVLAALAGFGGRATQHARFDVSAARAKVKLPAPKTAPASTLPPGADLGRSGVPWATPNSKFYRIDTALTLPQIDPKAWRLKIHGMVLRELELSFDQVLARPLVERWITLNCVSNEVGGELVGNALFRGVLLADLLREAGLQAGSDQLLLTSADGMTIGAPTAVVMDGRAALLAVGMNGVPLPIEHGFPARTVVPGLYGYVSACKWIIDIEATRFADHAAYWVREGWDKAPPLQLASRIDKPGNGKTVSVGDATVIAGVAWDQHVGVSKVEVQINDDPWQAATLATVPSTDTWRQWLLPWTPEKSGSYRLQVRAIDAKGRVQTARKREPYPAGATGWHSVNVHAYV